jgi:hypothetical protein
MNLLCLVIGFAAGALFGRLRLLVTIKRTWPDLYKELEHKARERKK